MSERQYLEDQHESDRAYYAELQQAIAKGEAKLVAEDKPNEHDDGDWWSVFTLYVVPNGTSYEFHRAAGEHASVTLRDAAETHAHLDWLREHQRWTLIEDQSNRPDDNASSAEWGKTTCPNCKHTF